MTGRQLQKIITSKILNLIQMFHNNLTIQPQQSLPSLSQRIRNLLIFPSLDTFPHPTQHLVQETADMDIVY